MVNVKYGMPQVQAVIAAMGRNFYIVKQDLQDYFLSFKIHPGGLFGMYAECHLIRIRFDVDSMGLNRALETRSIGRFRPKH